VPQRRQKTSSYAGVWLMSYVVPILAAWPVYALTHSAVAAGVVVVIVFVLFMAAAAKSR
jgi:apolipoprotein N-acyltransferase